MKELIEILSSPYVIAALYIVSSFIVFAVFNDSAIKKWHRTVCVVNIILGILIALNLESISHYKNNSYTILENVSLFFLGASSIASLYVLITKQVQ